MKLSISALLVVAVLSAGASAEELQVIELEVGEAVTVSGDTGGVFFRSPTFEDGAAFELVALPQAGELVPVQDAGQPERGPGGPGGPGGPDRGRGDWRPDLGDPQAREDFLKRMEERLGPERTAELRERMEAEYLRRYDKDGDGTVTDAEREQVRAEYEQRRQEAVQEWRNRELLRRWDENDNGKIDPEEQAKIDADKAAQEARAKEQLESVKKAYDADKDGELSTEELTAMREKVAEMITHLQAIEAVARAKRDAGDQSLVAVERQIQQSRGWGGGDRGRGGDDRGRGGDRPAASGAPGEPAPPRRGLTGE